MAIGVDVKIWRLVMREGFWKSKYEPELPSPVANDHPWEGQDEFLKALSKKERGGPQHRFKGSSLCRICGCINGSTEYDRGGWEWPSGFRHYVETHNVQPSPEFIDWVMG